MKRVVFLIVGLTIFLSPLSIFFSPVSFAQASDQQELNYLTLKNEYINNHPGQSIIPFPWEPSSSTKILPFNYPIPAVPANNFSITVCRNQFEAASFIITAQKDISGIGINVPNLYSAQGNSIPADAINVRLVKVWYQADDDLDLYINHPGSHYLTPELLLKDDSLVSVDYVNKTNYLKVTINGSQQYIDISNPAGTFPSNAQIQDTSSLQPFSLRTNENKQIWLTVRVPGDTPAGDYSGDITITTPSEAPVIMSFGVTVLPFDLEPTPVEYAIYYRAIIPPEPDDGINSEWKTPQQYARELQNMKEHGISYPTIYQGYDQMLGTALSLRNQTGLPKDHIYILGLGTLNRTSQSDLTTLKNEVTQWENSTSQYGYQDIYIYGMDEATDEILHSERPAWQTVKDSGANVFVAVLDNQNAVNIVGDLLDVAVFSGPLDTTQAVKWHSFGKQIFSYGNPQVGIENPEIYRTNYGFTLWNAGYDGAMDYAYQHGFGTIWNDFDDIIYRDHVFAYPVSNGVIDTIQWEGFREGVDDTRYLATLMKKEGNDTSARSIVTGSLSNGDDMPTIRKKVIDQILISYDKRVPVLSFISITENVRAVFFPHQKSFT